MVERQVRELAHDGPQPLALEHAQQQAQREQYEEEEASEAMWRLTRAFVLLCLLTLRVAQP